MGAFSFGKYGKKFFDDLEESSGRSARIVVPLILARVPATSIIDVGCGVGTWLHVFQEHGVEIVHGLDGPHVDRSWLEIPTANFQEHDLEQPYVGTRRYDLALCLEVAEHLSSDAAPRLVKSLVDLSDVVLFSAAIPWQGGENHLNEQWPDYWIDLFKRHDYVAVDCLRGDLWLDQRVDLWYRQNIMFFVSASQLDRFSELVNKDCSHPFSIVHPEFFERKAKSPLRKVLRKLPYSLRRQIANVRLKNER